PACAILSREHAVRADFTLGPLEWQPSWKAETNYDCIYYSIPARTAPPAARRLQSLALTSPLVADRQVNRWQSSSRFRLRIKPPPRLGYRTAPPPPRFRPGENQLGRTRNS